MGEGNLSSGGGGGKLWFGKKGGCDWMDEHGVTFQSLIDFKTFMLVPCKKVYR